MALKKQMQIHGQVFEYLKIKNINLNILETNAGLVVDVGVYKDQQYRLENPTDDADTLVFSFGKNSMTEQARTVIESLVALCYQEIMKPKPKSVQKLGEQGQPILDEEGNFVFEDVETNPYATALPIIEEQSDGE